MTAERDNEGPGLTAEAAREYVRRWRETGELLEVLRWRELAALDDARALRASDALLESAMLVPLPARRRQWSGLVEQQRLFRGPARP